MARFTASPLACGMMAATLLISTVASAQDPLGAPNQQRSHSGSLRHDANPQPRTSVGINHSQRQNEVVRYSDNDRRGNDRWDNDRRGNDRRDDHRGRDYNRYDTRHNDYRHRSHSGSHVTVNVNRSYPYYYNDYYYSPRPVYYRERYPGYYYTSSYYAQRPIPVIQESPYVEVRCGNQPIIGTVVGGVAGGLIGNQFGKGSGRTAMTIGGALLGVVIGNDIDRANESCAYQALEYAQPNTQVAWVDPNGDNAYTVTPGPISREDGRYCREYQAKVMVGGELQDGYGRACRQPDGSWEVVD